MLSTKYIAKTKELVVDVGEGSYISVYRERPVTAAEKRKDPEATTVSEWVHIRFSKTHPKIVINRDFCA